ncbi:hypothetical protein [Paenibacillus sp. GP183]|uniref:hypothetical protein n=1 Tax=Paenibacillus sp. GP183 TaxID=1882751 RepID=UPI0011150A7E|nr:hypothetical protein [Paenibacillus sp. GP183]
MTIAMQCGASYSLGMVQSDRLWQAISPNLYRKYFRYRPFISIDEVKNAKQLLEVIFVHPIKDNSVRAWISSQTLDTEGHS